MKISLLTFNCSALPFLTPLVPERLGLLIREIRRVDPDIVCLQEVGLESHARLLRAGLERWPHPFWARRPGGFVCGGLLLFSKLPHARASFTAFREQGPWLGYSYLARFSRKGYMAVDWTDPPLRLIHTHPLADYGASSRTWTDYAALQARQFRELVDFARRPGPPLAVAGDLNADPEAPWCRELIGELSLKDLMEGVSEPSMVSEDCFRSPPGAPKRKARIDYILVSGAAGRLQPGRADYVFDRKHRFGDGSLGTLSDHLGVLGRFSVERTNP